MSKIHPTSVIYDNVTIGDNVYIGPYCIIGAPAEFKENFGIDDKGVEIGNNVIITGNVTIDSGRYGKTFIGDNVFLMKNVHVGHDCTISDNSILSAHSCLAGHVFIGKNTNIGINSSIHQYSLVGGGSMIGMGSIITKKSVSPPFSKIVGSPGKKIGENTHTKIKLNESEINDIETSYFVEKNKKIYYNVVNE